MTSVPNAEEKEETAEQEQQPQPVKSMSESRGSTERLPHKTPVTVTPRTRLQRACSFRSIRYDIKSLQQAAAERQEETTPTSATKKTVEPIRRTRPEQRQKSATPAVNGQKRAITMFVKKQEIKTEIPSPVARPVSERKPREVKKKEIESDDDIGTERAIAEEVPKRRRGRPRKSSPPVTPRRPYTPRSGTGKLGRSRKRRTIDEEDPVETALNNCDVGAAKMAIEMTKFPIGSVFMKKWGIIDILPAIPGAITPSNHYLVTDKDSDYTTDAVLRCYPPHYMDRLFQEFAFLDKMEKYQRSHLALLAYDMKLVQTPDVTFCYIVTALRSGPTLHQLLAHHKKLTERDTARFAHGILTVFHQMSAIGYVLLDVDPDHFALDDETGRIYLSNCSNVAINFERHGMPETMEGREAIAWRGNEKYAPLAYHMEPNSPVTDCDCIEALFYMFLDMCGKLPWAKESIGQIVSKKRRWAEIEESGMSAELSSSLAFFWMNLRRGRRYVLKRTNNLANNNIILRDWRNRPNGKAYPTASMLEYPLFFDALRVFGGWDEDDCFSDLQWDFCEPETKVEYALISEINRLRVDLRTLEADVEVFERRKEANEKHKKQMKREVRYNERFLRNYLGSKEEPPASLAEYLRK